MHKLNLKDTNFGNVTDMRIPVRGLYTKAAEIYNELKSLIESSGIEETIELDKYMFIANTTIGVDTYQYVKPNSSNRKNIDIIKSDYCLDEFALTEKIYSNDYNYYIKIFKYDSVVFIQMETIYMTAIILPEFLFYEYQEITVMLKPGDRIETGIGAGTVIDVKNGLMTIDYDDEVMLCSEAIEETALGYYIKTDNQELFERQILDTLISYGGKQQTHYNYMTSAMLYYYIEPETFLIQKVREEEMTVPLIKKCFKEIELI